MAYEKDTGVAVIVIGCLSTGLDILIGTASVGLGWATFFLCVAAFTVVYQIIL